MKNSKTTTGYIMSFHRLPNSINGNPRFIVVLGTEGGGVLGVQTAPDSAVAYELSSYKLGESVKISHRQYYGKDTIVEIERLGTGKCLA